MEKIIVNEKICFLVLVEKLLDILYKHNDCDICINHKKYKNKVCIQFDRDYKTVLKVEIKIDYKKYPLRHMVITHLLNVCQELNRIKDNYYLTNKKIQKHINDEKLATAEHIISLIKQASCMK